MRCWVSNVTQCDCRTHAWETEVISAAFCAVIITVPFEAHTLGFCEFAQCLFMSLTIHLYNFSCSQEWGCGSQANRRGVKREAKFLGFIAFMPHTLVKASSSLAVTVLAKYKAVIKCIQYTHYC